MQQVNDGLYVQYCKGKGSSGVVFEGSFNYQYICRVDVDSQNVAVTQCVKKHHKNAK